MPAPSALDLTGTLPAGRVVLEASAGTGKTYALTALLVRAVAERRLRAEQLLVVTFTRAATAELRDRIRRALTTTVAALADDAPEPTDDWLKALRDVTDRERRERRTAVERALTELDAAAITTIHGFCNLTLRQVGIRGGGAGSVDLVGDDQSLVADVVRDLALRELVDDPEALDDPTADAQKSPATTEDRLRKAVDARLNNPTSVLEPVGDTDPAIAARFRGLVDEAVREVARRRRNAGETGYDDLLTDVDAILADPSHGPATCRAMRDRYRLVLVDEFQDTDPLQWRIFSRMFTEDADDLGPTVDLVVVGDPKQAIYRFRGADLHAYLDAVSGTDVTRLLLDTNHRSDAGLLRALEILLDGASFGDPRIGFQTVKARPGAPDLALGDGRPSLEVRTVPRHDHLLGSKGKLVIADKAFDFVLADLIAEAGRLLGGVTIHPEDGESRPIQPNDIAVLVKSHDDAELVVDALTQAGLPSVRSRIVSVLATPAADRWRLLLAALRRPADTDAVRALALGWFVGLDGEALLDDGRILHIQRTCRDWADLMARRGVFAAFREVIGTPTVLERLVIESRERGERGERDLTDLEHIGEVLHAETNGEPIPPAAVASLLERLVVEADDEHDAPERLRRIDSDGDAIQVTTVHAAKGLEFPIVLLPRIGKARNSSHLAPYVFNGSDGRRRVDAASHVDWTVESDESSDRSRRRSFATAEAEADDCRLLYVALTRARHRVVIWWAPSTRIGEAALTRALVGDRTEGSVDLSEHIRTIPDDDEVARRIGELVERSGGTLGHVVLGSRPAVPPTLATTGRTGRDVGHATVSRDLLDRTWRRWSFTELTNDLPPPSLLPPDPRGGDDEPPGDDDPEGHGADGGLLGLPAGRRTGNLLHDLFEHIDAAAADLEDHVLDTIRSRRRHHGDVTDPEHLAAGVTAVLRTPLEPLATDVRLCDIPTGGRLAELWFDLHLADGRRRINPSDLGRAVVEHDPDGPFADYFADLATSLSEQELGGRLVGSIDAVLRLPDGRFSAVDYKSNRLHDPEAADPLGAYGTMSMRAAMVEHHYPLQALLYSVALHRFLRWRLAGYAPDTHLAPTGYLFVRAMVGEETPVLDGGRVGVHTWNPGAETVLAVDRVLAGGR